jgi:excisionase family DNA binding protein
MEARYLTKKELGAYLKVSRTIIEKCMREGMPYNRFGRRVLFRQDLVDAWLEARMIRAKKP